MSVKINASTSSGLVVDSDLTGSLRLQTGGNDALTVDSSQVVNFTKQFQFGGVLPPAFFYTHNTGGDQSVSANTWTKVLFETKTFDTNNLVSSSRFTPNIAGYYQISGSLYAGTGSLQLRVYKNGSAYANIGQSVSQNLSCGSTLVYCNGSTDYIELYGNTATTSFYTDGLNVYFAGVLVRAA